MARLSRRRFISQAAVAASAVCVAPGALGGDSSGGMGKAAKGREAMRDALALLANTGPEYHGGLANHGPMAAEALVAMERPEAVVPWVERYRKGLDAHPSEKRAIGPGEWREALGERSRVGDWIGLFHRSIAERPWRDVLREWVPRLSPGIVAAAFHGVIRTGHAVRSLTANEAMDGDPARRRELAEGLAYWAANFHTFPEARVKAPAARLPSRALASVPAVPHEKRVDAGFILDRLAPVEHLESFRGVADLVDASGDASRFLSDLTETFAGVYLASVPPGSIITFIHGVTGPSAVRLLLPHLDARSKETVLRYAWQGAAAFFSGGGGVAPPAWAAAPDALPKRDDLVDRAVATGDEHAIKFTEACLREYALNPKPVYLAAARHATTRLA